MKLSVHLLTVTYLLTRVSSQGINKNETDAKEFLKTYNDMASSIWHDLTLAEWQVFENDKQSDINLLRQMTKDKASFMRDMRARALNFDASAMSSDTQRQLSKIKNIGIAAQSNGTKADELSDIMAYMERTYMNGRFCDDTGDCSRTIVPGLFTPDGGQKGLTPLWVNWRNNTGRLIKNHFTKYVALSNEAVRLTGYSDLGAHWRSRYESDNFRAHVSFLYRRIRPLYEQVHAHVRKVLDKMLKKPFPKTGHIPACILGNVMADEWSHVYIDVAPFKRHGYGWSMTTNNYRPFDPIHMAEKFFLTLGFGKMSRSFWKKSTTYHERYIHRGYFRGFVWDFYDQKDFRLAVTPFVSQPQLFEAFNLMAQIHYLKQYKNQSVIYREGANDAFLDAVGGAIDLSIRNLQYFKNIGLMKNSTRTYKQEINYLMWIAMEKVTWLPFAYLVDEWRWSVFNGSTTPKDYNKVWWRLRCDLQGVSPPAHRLADDFDPGSLYEIAANKPYIRYFISTILQFQIYKGLCHAAKQKGSFYKCNLQNSTAAGKKLRALMGLGSSVPWQTALKQVSHHGSIEPDAMLEFFKPLMDYLSKKNGENHGWERNCDKKVKVYG